MESKKWTLARKSDPYPRRLNTMIGHALKRISSILCFAVSIDLAVKPVASPLGSPSSFRPNDPCKQVPTSFRVGEHRCILFVCRVLHTGGRGRYSDGYCRQAN